MMAKSLRIKGLGRDGFQALECEALTCLGDLLRLVEASDRRTHLLVKGLQCHFQILTFFVASKPKLKRGTHRPKYVGFLLRCYWCFCLFRCCYHIIGTMSKG